MTGLVEYQNGPWAKCDERVPYKDHAGHYICDIPVGPLQFSYECDKCGYNSVALSNPHKDGCVR